MRIIQHRLSRRNSLTILQLQNLGDLGKNKGEKKPTQLTLSKRQSNGMAHVYGRSQLSPDIHRDISKGTILSEDEQSQTSLQSDGSEHILLDNFSSHSALTAIKVRGHEKIVVRKSANFQTMLKHIDNSLEKKESTEEIKCREVIHLDGEQQEAIKISQLQDLITKHLQKGGVYVSRQGV